MSCTILGPGLVGSYLGAAARSENVIPRSGIAAKRVQLGESLREWNPRSITFRQLKELNGPLLVASRVPDTPWRRLPDGTYAAQNGLGQPINVITCFFALDVDQQGVLRAEGPAPRVVMAPPPPEWESVLAAWSSNGITVEVRSDARSAQWEKTILAATVGPLCLATGMSMAEVWSDPELRSLTLKATTEGERIARACGIAIPQGIEERAAHFFSHMRHHVPSLLKNPGELPWILGHLQARARQHGISCPNLRRIEQLVIGRDHHKSARVAVAVPLRSAAAG